ncbi:DUF192 domain-containing protein [Gelidibacter japonicus]|uniref:DUF192 domain-containing protein n=1 Tax=Gelidibacter japonicus TaxID=1962232 RepID=UPI00202010F7|nr:DUF192 domain-containing protein [Gelidibacter japonicus]MCL8008375.1 DUF192 domain-containing protein [Gelidibacter japonicus]
MKKSAFQLVVLLTLGVSCLQFQSCKEEQRVIKPVVIEFKKEAELVLKNANDSIIKKLDIEIADDEYKTQTGLMYRDQMGELQGMLFVFPDEDFRSFYMKNTNIPLDIIYIDADKKIVSFQKNTQPNNETSLPSNAPAKYVLEINAGLADEWQLEVGDKMEYIKVE